MKRDCPSLMAALTVGIIVNTLLRIQSSYWPRAGVITAFFCVPLLAAVAWVFSRAWRCGQTPLFRLLFAALLLYTSVLELLRFWKLAQRLYPGDISLVAVCLMTLLPVVYLRRVSAISQTAHVVLCTLILATGFMFLTVLPRLHLTNLQLMPLQQEDFSSALQEQMIMYPEYLLPVLWPLQKNELKFPRFRLVFIAVWFDVAIHFILELFYGAAMPLRLDPIHAAARCGALSVFNRLESLQLILWGMAVALKLALYLYAVKDLLPRKQQEGGSSVTLQSFPLYFAGLWLLCVFYRKADLQYSMQMRNLLTWGFVVLVGMGGAAAWICKKLNNAS